jgi:septal ring factor EnvC (AmiA/AmiB activator)
MIDIFIFKQAVNVINSFSRTTLPILASTSRASSGLLKSMSSSDEKCSIKEFTNKRREILMLNLSIQEHQEEIDTLHATLKEKEDILHKRDVELGKKMKTFEKLMQERNHRESAAVQDQVITK